MSNIRSDEFTCIDCGIEVVRFARLAANDDAVCGICAFLRTVTDDRERAALRAVLQPREPRK